MASDRFRRVRVAVTCIGCLLSGCIARHSLGRPYSCTAYFVSSIGRPWACYAAAPSKTLALVEAVPYTASVAALAAASTAAETLIVPVDLVADYDDGAPLAPQEALFEPCDEYWGTQHSDAPPAR
jgi:hypothetical protein